MHIISHRKLKEFYESPGKEDSRIALERWYNIALNAQWHNFSEIREDFPPPLIMLVTNTMYSTSGNNYRLVVVVKFTIGRIFIRFVGTHAEYDRIDCSTI